MRTAAADISRNVTDLNELISKLDQAVKDNTGLGAYDEQRKQAAANITPNITPNSPPRSRRTPPPRFPRCPRRRPKRPGNVAEGHGPRRAVAERDTWQHAGRIKPEIAFSEANGRLPMPAQGRQVLGFSEKTQFGGQSKGIVLETRQGAQVTSPCDGWIVYAGEFRSYGQLLIINAGGGYHVLLAGLSQIDVQPGPIRSRCRTGRNV